VTERFDTSTPSGRLLRNIMLTFAAFERELISERVRDKVIQRVKRGLHTGGLPPFGYKSDRGTLVLDPPRDQHIKLIFETYAKTQSIRSVLKALSNREILTRRGRDFYDSVIWNLLRNPIYTGQVLHKKKLHPGRHPAIISTALFDHVQKIKAEAPRGRPTPETLLPFAGLIRCEECGSIMTVSFTDKKNTDGKKRYYYYRCSKLSHQGWNTCSTRQISAERLHDIVYKNLLRISQDTDHIKNLLYSLQNKPSSPTEMGIEPLQEIRDLTPETVQKDLTAYVQACARKTGIEKVVVVRRGIERIHYSKKSLRVDYVLGGSVCGSESRRPCRNAGPTGNLSDGKREIERGQSAGGGLAGRNSLLPSSDCSLGRVPEPGRGIESETGEAKRPDHVARSSPSVQFESKKSGAGEGNRTLVCSLEGCRSTIELHPQWVPACEF
jgi:site-specific DNA recombinase